MTYQQQYLHSSVLPRLTMASGQQRPARPLSDATSIASSTDFDDEMQYMSQNKVSRPPVYKYSNYDDMDIEEDEMEDDAAAIDPDSIDNLFSKAKRMNTWLSVSDGRNSVGSVGYPCRYDLTQSLTSTIGCQNCLIL